MTRLSLAVFHPATSDYWYFLSEAIFNEVERALPFFGMFTIFHLQASEESYVAQNLY